MSSIDLISLRNQPPIWQPVPPKVKRAEVVLLVELVDQLVAAAELEPGIVLALVHRERQAGLEHEVRRACRSSSRPRSGRPRRCRSARRRRPAGPGRFRRRRRRGPGTCRPTSRRSAWRTAPTPPYSVSSDLGKLDVRRHFTSGMLCAMAGAATVDAAATPAAPTPAVLMNFLRCIDRYPP